MSSTTLPDSSSTSAASQASAPRLLPGEYAAWRPRMEVFFMRIGVQSAVLKETPKWKELLSHCSTLREISLGDDKYGDGSSWATAQTLYRLLYPGHGMHHLERINWECAYVEPDLLEALAGAAQQLLFFRARFTFYYSEDLVEFLPSLLELWGDFIYDYADLMRTIPQTVHTLSLEEFNLNTKDTRDGSESDSLTLLIARLPLLYCNIVSLRALRCAKTLRVLRIVSATGITMDLAELDYLSGCSSLESLELHGLFHATEALVPSHRFPLLRHLDIAHH